MENGSEDTEECREVGDITRDNDIDRDSRSDECAGKPVADDENDPNFVEILLSSTPESEPLCETASEWTPMPQPLVVDSGAVETVIPRTWPNHKTAESEGCKRGVFCTLADGSTVENGGGKNADHVNSRWVTTAERDIPSS